LKKMPDLIIPKGENAGIIFRARGAIRSDT
jgi:hypothetical protein